MNIPSFSPLQMAEKIRDRIGLADTPHKVLDLLTPNGEMWPLGAAFCTLFAAEYLPADVAKPKTGDIRYRDEQLQVWNGAAWDGAWGGAAYRAQGLRSVAFLLERKSANPA